MRIGPLALGLALGALALGASPVHAAGSHQYDVCGGSYYGYHGFALCASVNVSVTEQIVGGQRQHTVTMTIYNLSGQHGSYDGTVFTAFSLANVVPSAVRVIDGSLRITGPCLSSGGTCEYQSEWQLSDNEPLDSWLGGWLPLDLRTYSENGVAYGIASSCGGLDPSLEGTPLLVTDCDPIFGMGVTISFRVDRDFEFDEGSLYILGQNGPPHGAGVTVCVTSEGGNCGPLPSTVVPEPVTIALLGTGLAGMGGFGALRRRFGRKEDEEA